MRLARSCVRCAVAIVARFTAVLFFTGPAAALVPEHGSVNRAVATIIKIFFISEYGGGAIKRPADRRSNRLGRNDANKSHTKYVPAMAASAELA